MRFAVFVPNIGAYADADLHGHLAVEAEKSGWDGFMTYDILHPLEPARGAPVVDAWTAMTVVADRTRRIRFSALVTPVPRRRPTTLARQTTALDRLSGGRFTLSVGLGVAESMTALGEEPNDRTRAAMLDEGLEVLQGLWSGETFSFEGSHYQVREACFAPPPVQSPRIPIWVAAERPSKRPLARAGRWDGMAPISPRFFEDGFLSLERFAEMVRYARRERDPAAPFDVTVITGCMSNAPGGTPENIAAYERVGATWWLENVPLHDVAAGLALIRSGPPPR